MIFSVTSSNYIFFFLQTSNLFTLSLSYDLGKMWYSVECPFIFALAYACVLVSPGEMNNINIQHIPLNLAN